jgi:hypothetical protein
MRSAEYVVGVKYEWSRLLVNPKRTLRGGPPPATPEREIMLSLKSFMVWPSKYKPACVMQAGQS